MSSTQPSPSTTNHRAHSNRVPRACDRCRIRKIKCNGKSQCSRCNLDDAICIYSKRRVSRDKVYSREYVALLEQQQQMLISGLKELYQRARKGEDLPDLKYSEDEFPQIQHVLESLDVLHDGVHPRRTVADQQIEECGDLSSPATAPSPSETGDVQMTTQSASPPTSTVPDRHGDLNKSLLTHSVSQITDGDLVESPTFSPFGHASMMVPPAFETGSVGPPSGPVLSGPKMDFTYAQTLSDVYLLGNADLLTPNFYNFVDPFNHAVPMDVSTQHSHYTL